MSANVVSSKKISRFLILFIIIMADTSTMYVSKKMQYAKLRDELKILEKNIDTLDRNVKDTVDQVPSFRKMGTLHASM